MPMDVMVGDILVMKKNHPCGNNQWQVLRIGATQHYAIVDGDWRKELEDFAQMMGFEFYSIK